MQFGTKIIVSVIQPWIRVSGSCMTVWSRGKAPVLVWGTKSPTSWSFLHIFALCGSSKILGVSTYRWAPQGQKLRVFGHRGHQWIDACTQINNRPATSLNTPKSVKLIQYKDINNKKVTPTTSATFLIDREFLAGCYLFTVWVFS